MTVMILSQQVGRVLCVTGLGESVTQAQAEAYKCSMNRN